ncbi:MAG TPA: LPS assembly lipoprotein LptE [Burkholderiales bacterium]|nr:LPS assembly lipoprotein LptE [Burkholderiales bacterium]
MRAALGLVLAALLAGCGFQLRGTADLPFETLYMPPAAAPGIALDLKRNIQAGTRTKVVDDQKQAQAVLEFAQEVRDRQILSLASTGRVNEFRLRYLVTFRVHDGKGGDFVPSSTVTLTRDVTYNDADVLSKQTEEQLLYRDMQFDMVQLIMRRLAAAKQPKAVAQ